MVSVDEETDVLWLWDSGFNTKEIADRLGRPEHEIEKLLRYARDKRAGRVNEFA